MEVQPEKEDGVMPSDDSKAGTKLRKRTFRETVPVHFTLENVGKKYVMCPRTSFIPLEFEKAFQSISIDSQSHISFTIGVTEFTDWTLPIGVIYDLFFGKERILKITVKLSSTEKSLELIYGRLKETVQSFASMSMKEGLYARYKNDFLTKFPVASTNSLWDAIFSRDYETYTEYMDELLAENKTNPIGIPFKILRTDKSQYQLLKVSTIVKSDGTPVLLQELLSGIIPNEKPFDALIQGAPIRLDTPLAWIDKALCNFDMINYIVIRLK